MGWRVLDLSGSGYEKVASSCDHSNKTWRSTNWKGEKFLDHLGNSQSPRGIVLPYPIYVFVRRESLKKRYDFVKCSGVGF